MRKALYDQETNILTLKLKNAKSVDSDVQDNIVVDYDKHGDIVRLEMMDFSLNEFDRVKPHLKRLMLQRA